MERKVKCLFVASEVAPYAKTGGLGDVVSALPKALRERGIDARVVMPYYKSMRDRFFDHESSFLTSYVVHLGWRKQGVGLYYDETNVPTYFVKSDFYFTREEGYYGYGDDAERFAFFSKAVLEMIKHIDFVPDIIHCNDWQTGPVCLLLKEGYRYDPLYSHMKSVFTIHNMRYQGVFDKKVLELLEVDNSYAAPNKLGFEYGVSFMKAGLIYSDKINTVSESYVDEVKTPEYGYGLHGLLECELYEKFTGILNGIDYARYNPATDPYIFKNYTVDTLDIKKENKAAFRYKYAMDNSSDSMMIGIVSRLTGQKGFNLMKQMVDGEWFMEKLMQLDVQFVLLGTGEKEYEDMFFFIKERFGDHVRIFIEFDEKIAQEIYAASDVFLMPSEFEPCGLGQLMAMRYGSVPIVRKTGGLKDTVTHYNIMTGEGTGFEFEDYSGYWLYRKIAEAHWYYKERPADFRRIQENGMRQDYSWQASAEKYIGLYRELIG